MRKSARVLAVAAALASQAIWGLSPVLNAAPAVDQRVRESERKQQMVRAQTARLGEDLAAVIAEFESNGLGDGEDVKVLRLIRGVLGNLSDKDMARVVELLGASRGDDAGKARARLAEAFGGQKNIVVQLRQLLLEYERQQQLYELSLRFSQLANRQNQNLKDAKRLVRSLKSSSATLDRFDENQKVSLSVQKDEQAAILGETDPLVNRLKGLVAENDGPTGERLTESFQQAEKGKLVPSLKNAVEELKAGSLFRAAGSQKNARDNLRELSRLVAPPREPQEILRLAAAELERVIIEQKLTNTQTQAMHSAAQQLKSEEPFFEAEDRQGDVVDRTDMVQKDVAHLAPIASDQLKKGEDRMQEARTQILAKDAKGSGTNQDQALVHLDAARKAILEALAREEKKNEQPQDKLAAAKQLKEKVAELKKEQEELKKTTEQTKEQKEAKKKTEEMAKLAPPQGKLQDQARELQPEAVTESQPAADAIAEAAKEMGKAQQQLDKKDAKTEQATAPQQAAIEQLAKAEKILDNEIAKLEQAKTDLDELAKAREKIENLIKNETKIEIATAKAETQQKAAEQPKPDAAKPDAAKPDAAKPDAAKPDVPKPEAAASKFRELPLDPGFAEPLRVIKAEQDRLAAIERAKR
ncbi:MAG TPA: hypothetical protein VK986_24750, partial [Tepidisphaeraceae bacterium]|nr:hypothetical protein [Tepidisphaeraceae bacterium]